VSINNLRKLSFLVYGLGLTGKSVINFFDKNKIKDYQVWDDKNKSLFKKKRPKKLKTALKEVNYIVLSPGINLKKSKHKDKILKYKKKIVTDLDLIFLLKKTFKSIVVTGTNGKSTTCKIINHILKKNNFNTSLGGNIGTPILNLKIKKGNFIIIEASSFQLAYSRFITPDFAILLNITNDHLDWHGNMENYINSKLKIFENQKRSHHSIVNSKFKMHFKKKKFLGKLIVPKQNEYNKIKLRIKNSYLTSNINDENMSNVYELSKILKISQKSFISSLSSFKGLPHRYESFLKKDNFTFINDSKATSFQATKFALKNTKNIFWILGGLPKKDDKIILKDLKKNIIKCYIIGKNINFFKKQIKNQIDFTIAKNLKNSIKLALSDLKLFNQKKSYILFSPASASFDQFQNFEKRGEEFKRLSKLYAG
tara:strand:- start:19852 stop:21126 length:1275 start_codon:yes stop_codon:yes gene_type:complete